MDSTSVKCSNCGKTGPRTKFCNDCGQRLALTACPECGRGYKLGARFCDACGTALEPPAAARPQSAATPELNPVRTQPSAPSNWLQRPAQTPSSTPTNVYGGFGRPESEYPDAWSSFSQAPAGFSESTSHRSSVGLSAGSALARAAGVFGLLVLGIVILFLGIGILADRQPEQVDLAGIMGLLVLVGLWIGSAIWAARRAGWGWTLAFFCLGPVAVVVYSYKAARSEVPRHLKRFPSFQSAALLTVAGLVFAAVAFLGNQPAAEIQATDDAGMGSVSAAAVSPTATTASVVADVLESTTPSPVRTSEAANTPRPNATRTASPEVTATPKPKRTPGPKPTRTPKASPTATADSLTAFDPKRIARDLLYESVEDSENPGWEDPVVWRDKHKPTGALDLIVMSVDMGEIRYTIYETDAAAREAVTSMRSGYTVSLPYYPGYITAVETLDGITSVHAAVGNVVVQGRTTSDVLNSSGFGGYANDVEWASAVIADYGVQRLIRLAGFEPEQTDTQTG